MQRGFGMEEGGSSDERFLEKITHVVVDEVHERDVETDLLLFTLKKALDQRRRMGKKLFKVVLMYEKQTFSNVIFEGNSKGFEQVSDDRYQTFRRLFQWSSSFGYSG
jgi:hypothetical protein